MLSRIARGLSENLPVLSHKQEQTCAKPKSRFLAQGTENTTKFVVLRCFRGGKNILQATPPKEKLAL